MSEKLAAARGRVAACIAPACCNSCDSLSLATLQAVDACAMDQGTAAQLLQVWRELRASIESWLQARDQPSTAILLESRVHASAVWAVQAMQDAIRLGDEAVVQVSMLLY